MCVDLCVVLVDVKLFYYCTIFRIVSEDTPLRARRSLLAVSSVNQTNITLEFGNPPQMNITTPEPPTVADEIAMDREINDSVDLEVYCSYSEIYCV